MFFVVLVGCHNLPFGCLGLRCLLPWALEVQAWLALDQDENKGADPQQDLQYVDASGLHDSASCCTSLQGLVQRGLVREREKMLPDKASLKEVKKEGEGLKPSPSTLRTWKDVTISTSLYQSFCWVFRIIF